MDFRSKLLSNDSLNSWREVQQRAGRRLVVAQSHPEARRSGLITKV